jgi:hypothetical protein
MNAEAVFRAKAPGIMAKLLSDFPITPLDAAAILGNLGHECVGFTKLQEMKPTVPGSRGGYGWAQWTGPRRRAFEAWCSKHDKDPASDEANYAWLFLELKGIEGTEGAAIGKTLKAADLDAKVEAFEKAFLRAGGNCGRRELWTPTTRQTARQATILQQSPSPPLPSPQPSPPRATDHPSASSSPSSSWPPS